MESFDLDETIATDSNWFELVKSELEGLENCVSPGIKLAIGVQVQGIRTRQFWYHSRNPSMRVQPLMYIVVTFNFLVLDFAPSRPRGVDGTLEVVEPTIIDKVRFSFGDFLISADFVLCGA